MNIDKKKYVVAVEANPLHPSEYSIKRDSTKKMGALAFLEELAQGCDPEDAAKTIKIAIVAHEIFRGYAKKSTGFWARICYGIRKLFGLHKKIDTQNKAVSDVYQRILASAQACYLKPEPAIGGSTRSLTPAPASISTAETATATSPPPSAAGQKDEAAAPAEPPIPNASALPPPPAGAAAETSQMATKAVDRPPIPALAAAVEALAAPSASDRPAPLQIAAVANQLEAIVNTPSMQEKILEKRRLFNETAFTALVEELEKDPTIPPAFLQAFRASWKAPESDDQIIPLEIKQHKKLFSRALRQEILASAKKAANESDKEKIAESLENLRKNILQDLNSGRIIPADKVIQDRYKGFFDLLKKAREGQVLSGEEQILWKEKYNEIVNNAYLHYEVGKKSKNPLLTKPTGSKIENHLLELLGRGKEDDPIEKKKRNLANLKVMETLMGGQGLDKISIEELKLRVAEEQRLARLQGPGIPQARRAAQLIDALEEKRQALQREAEPFTKEITTLDSPCPPKNKKKLLQKKKRTLQYKISSEIFRGMKTSSILAEIKNYLSENSGDLNKIIDRFNRISPEEISTDFDKNPRNFQFYNKWGSQFLLELIQGNEDKNEALGNGVCCAINSRWIQKELENKKNKIDADFIRIHQLDAILPEDRVAQCLYESSLELPKIYLGNISVPSDELKRYNEIIFPKQFRDRFNFAPLTELPKTIAPNDFKEKNDYSTTEKQQHHHIWKDLFQKQLDTLPPNQKIVDLGLSFEGGGHAIYIRYDLENGIFRIGDPNYGLIEIKEGSIEEKKNNFIECLADLMMEYNTKYCSFINWELEK